MIRRKDPRGFEIPEPRIPMLARQLERILSLVDLEWNGQRVRANGFRLKELSRWQTGNANTAMNALTPISSVCNSKCRFCFEENVPYARETSLMPLAEAETRLKYFDPATGHSLFPSSRHHMETFIHPRALDIIERARNRQPEKLFWITTNGSHLTEEVVQRLARLQPLILKLSLNVVDEGANKDLMRTGRRTRTAIQAAPLLEKHRVPFMGGIVAWPTLTEAQIEETVHYLAAHSAYAIRLRLPLSHRWLNDQRDTDFHMHWSAITRLADRLRPGLDVPLFVEPPIYWTTPVVPLVDGVVKNSPAFHAGVRPGDLITAINDERILTRIASEATLDRLHVARERSLRIDVQRNGAPLSLYLKEAPADTVTYPYSFDYFYRGENYGIFHVEDFRLSHVHQLIERIRARAAHRVLLFSSAPVAPVFETIAEGIPEFKEALSTVDVELALVEDNHFGGNYDMMDSRVVSDYSKVIRQRLEAGRRYDLILIPDAFGSPWGIDVFGRSVYALEQEFSIPVERIDWLLVYGREV